MSDTVKLKPKVTFSLKVKHPGSDVWEDVEITDLKVEAKENGDSASSDDGGSGLDR